MAQRYQSRPKPGNVYSVRRAGGGFFLLVYITKNRWGFAFGILDGYVSTPHLPEGMTAAGGQNPVYSCVEPILKGTWQFLVNREELLQLFPVDPELYHEPEESDEFGPYGCAELPSGDLRKVEKEEADKIGLGKLYFQVMHDQQLENYLHTGNPLVEP